VLRQTERVNDRRLWARVVVRDGWLELNAFADAANLHLAASRELITSSFQAPERTEGPLAALILSASALEAFANQVAFFLKEVQDSPAAEFHPLPSELSGDVLEFQRRTGLLEKWEILGRALCDDGWPPPKQLWEDFCRLLDIRNELVHFKSAEYEQLIPASKKPHRVIRRLPAGVTPRAIQEPWPMRILTPDLAKWAVDTAQGMIDYFRGTFVEID
jgi:hypothetical protein